MGMEEITVYWAPATFTNQNLSSDLLYSEPESILNKFIKTRIAGSEMSKCPATKNLLKNFFALTSNIEDNFSIMHPAEGSLLDMSGGEYIGMGKVPMQIERKTSIEGYINVTYNLRWLMFASESVEMRIVSPFFPSSSICENALFSPGQFDIGKWYRHINLDWHIPLETKDISIAENQELAYLEFLTNKKIIFKRYVPTPRLLYLATDTINSGNKYGKGWPLSKKYELSKKAGFPDLVLSEIRNNIV